MKKLVKSTLKPKSLARYESVWDCFQSFVINVLCLPLIIPFDVVIILRYIAYLFLKNLSLSTVKQHLAAISLAHYVRGLGDPTKNPMVLSALKGIHVMI